MSHLTQSMVEHFFELEKESARGVLRKEMDSAMDTIFKQMKRKLMLLVASLDVKNEIVEVQDDFYSHVLDEQQLSISKDTNPIPSTTTTNSQAHLNVLNVSNLSQIDQIKVNSAIDNCIKSTNESITIPATSTQSNGDTSNQLQVGEIVVKKEFDETVNITPIPSSSTQPQPFNEQFNDNIDDLFDEEVECDCPECVGDLFVKMEEGVDYSVQLVEDPDETDDSNPKPTKRPRLENDQSQTQNQTEPTIQTTPNRYITISLKCPECSQIYPDRNALNVHLEAVHWILKYRCLYKDCNRSFKTKDHFGHHQQTAHPAQPNSTWPCGYCCEHFQSSKSLLAHYSMQHEEGLFRCSYPDCQFVDRLKQTVHNHFMIIHKGGQFVCQYPGCELFFQHSSALKNHERRHRNARPYRCKLPDCTYDSATKGDTLRHIRTHLKKVGRQNKQWKNMSDDPNEYLEVVHQLL